MKIKVKVGSSTLVNQVGELHYEAFAYISDEITELVACGHQVAVTTSGFAAAGGGKNRAAYEDGGSRIEAEWRKHLGQRFGGLYFVRQATFHRSVDILGKKLDYGKIPLTNEHFDDQGFGGNDLLAVALARSMCMDRVIFLGDMPGICRDVNDLSSVFSRIELDHIEEYSQFARTTSYSGTGGIEAKLAAAQEAARDGITTHYGHWQSSIDSLIAGASGTTFVEGKDALS